MSDIIYGGAIDVEQKRKRLSVGRPHWGFSIAIWPYRVDWFDAFAVMCGIASSAVYSWYIDNWLKGMSIGILMFIMGWMVMEWFILGDDDYSASRNQAHKKKLGRQEPILVPSNPLAVEDQEEPVAPRLAA